MIDRIFNIAKITTSFFLILLQWSSFSFAQTMFFSMGNADLFSFDVPTHTATRIDTIHSDSVPSLVMLDIASDYQGRLFGMGGDTFLYEIDVATAHATPIGTTPTGITGIGMTFTPDNVLWVIGYGSIGNALYNVDTTTGVGTPFVVSTVTPSGDIGYNPVTKQLYISVAGYPNDLLYEIDRTTGATTYRGDFSAGGVWGMDFTGDQQKMVGMSMNTAIYMDVNASGLWSQTASYPTSASECWGATKYHCVSNAAITINGLSHSPVQINFGDPLIVNGADSTHVQKYEWKISGKNSAGVDTVVTISGEGTPGTLDLINDPDHRFDALDIFHTSTGAHQDLMVQLTTWCDPFEAPSIATLTIRILSYKVSIPNAFTPNGDGLNDQFRAIFAPVQPSYVELTIHNRWGQLIYQGENGNAAWDGFFNGVPQEIGTYFYELSFEMSGAERQYLKGTVTLIR